MELQFFVEGTPIPKARPRVGKYGTYTPSSTLEWESLIAWSAKANYFGEPSQERISLDCTFYGARANADLDNLGKAVLDAMNGIVYADDKQIDTLCFDRQRATDHKPGVLIRVRSL